MKNTKVLEILQEVYSVEAIANEDLEAIAKEFELDKNIKVNHETMMVYDEQGNYIADVKEWK